jgi:PAS domain S-box-containing protein
MDHNRDSFEGANLTDSDGTPNPLLKAAVESANDAIIITEALLDLPGPRIEYVNPAFTRMTGYAKEEAIGQTPRMLQGPKTDRELLKRLRDDLEQSRSFHGETINYRKDGTEYYVEWRITPLFDAQNRVAKWVAIQRDVTPRIRAEQALANTLDRERTARAEAERQLRSKDEFLATLGHELRTPLNAIMGWTSILQSKKATDEDVAEGIAVIGRNARAQTRLVEDLLDMSRIITGKMRLDVQRVELPSVIDSAIAAVQHGADTKGVRIKRVIDPLAGPVSGDPNRLQQVIWNLLTNAVKFTNAGGQVQVTLERVNSHIELAVSDTGIGIAPQFLPHVFERFTQAESTSTRRFGGLGIGLAICRHLVEMHGGSIRVKSPGEGHGSTFIINLPLSLKHAGDEGDVPDDDVMADEGQIDLSTVRVLVVDDDPDGRELMRRVLAGAGASVTTAVDGHEACMLFELNPPDIYISDIAMPGMDGYTAIKAIRSKSATQGANVPAVAVTAYARPEDRKRAIRAGFDMHIAKPIDPDELLAIVARLTNR